jgi:hypothetical protein
VVGVLFQQRQHGPGAVVAGVVDHEHHPPIGVSLEQLPEELAERLSVLPRVDQVVGLPRPVVERAVDADPLVDPGRRDDRPDAADRPDLGQGRVEVNLTLVEVEQVEPGVEPPRPPFTNARKAFFSSYSRGSRR